MNQRPMAMNKGNMVAASERAAARVKKTLELAKQIENDDLKEDRVLALRCKACFYFSGIGGCAMTTRPCMSCGKDQMYSSTNTDVLCAECAKEANLCKHCGGDIDMRSRRRNWPKRQDVEPE